ncbi:3-deoxy-manno-octulosonate cytidylyltransferase : 3-deoxy-manno-octulosonate cytidylyltransferase OS=Singulisphaera acidiphila (strain ATCC BAA-1392 / DSM 18658 / VKM B-2454 / MOB10) GN=kdsB PE=3 SV=1: CTP_transf_3 [Gemmataceae bacterium]|nr:3-deoxy-manno-octulosonate cytidylyltransferase : 3-deoxy-manno-octulosonate cytidylyltransferase OS=Singulisphaera acidiphila (strain ATCC BAA-1392 / DSM 18658 / VKM B-2454 / MOB10) GN=kdsB PE=3 SV=1: CTP_transf_3 [Gemmataceae bacterium]VTT96690.1 3-deoxy-manno-octulosonate cytidylyltransferase : 3-deoxy-manno-octulosonate cytidylyltransferase OS=Singulisphaera acidiphila (strain ATCC BAA-1392 / DSM 18658 / VKM B-2454 / MOB10) GN=kdsB PE=3 SV=1: CTP_transf_3 [Gemmataceae bacterium]
MRVAIVIPARFASTRLPAKPLLRETGKYLIEHTYEQASRAKCAADVIVATDDDRIFDAVRSFGGRVVMTRADHVSGTDRIAEVAAHLPADVVLNVQGDEPQIEPAALDLLAGLMTDPASDMATLAVPVATREAYLDPNVVKVVSDDRGRALYFSRRPIPMVRDGEPDFAARPARFLQHLGVYAYRQSFLLKIAATPPHPLEQAEKLEQLRVLGTGGTIRVGLVENAHRGIDTPADYADFVRTHRDGGTRRAA